MIAIPTKLDDVNLTPEAYRLYLHFRSKMARQEGPALFGGSRPDFCVDGLVLEMHQLPTYILRQCRISYEPNDASIMQFFRELEDKRLVQLSTQYRETRNAILPVIDLYIETVTFVPESDWYESF